MGIWRKLGIISIIAMLLSSTTMASANGDSYDRYWNDKDFYDVDSDYWAYDYIELMREYGIIDGFEDGSFKPEEEVTRAQFAKMMVATLQLNLINPGTPTFVDVNTGNWAYKYVETARNYLTGFVVNGDTYYFKPSLNAVREDMAVALVKALGYKLSDADLSVLDDYSDEEDVSENLRKYMALAVDKGIMTGDGDELDPQGELTRAEAAKLLAVLIQEEKITFDETKVVLDGTQDAAATSTTTSKTPVLTASGDGDEIDLSWTKTASGDNFSYYKVVLSKSDSTPSYPDNGYLTYISDRYTTTYSLHEGQDYNGGDIDELESGMTYYVSITAVYGDGKYTSNVLTIRIP